MSNLPRGQILPGSKFGDLLTELAKDAETIVEVGTWYGEGSTLCLYRGLIRLTQQLWSFDVSSEMASAAQRLYENDPRVYIVCNSASAIDCDLLLIDGGEGDGPSDFALLSPVAKVIALDDTNTPKNKANAEFLRNSPDWEAIYDAPEDRNGCGVWKRKCT